VTRQVPKLAGEPIELVVPRNLAQRWGVMTAWQNAGSNVQMLQLVGAGALGLCWPRFRVKKDTPQYKHDLLEYGEQVLDRLLQAGAPMKLIQQYSVEALKLCTDGLVSKEDIEAAESFSEPTRDGSRSSSSASSAPGTGTQAGSEPSTETPSPS
jgi:hypothetical protein